MKKLRFVFIFIVAVLISQVGNWTSAFAFDNISGATVNPSGHTMGYTATNRIVGTFFSPSVTETIDDITLIMSKSGTPTDNVFIKVYNYGTATAVGSLIATSDNISGSIVHSSMCTILDSFSCFITFHFSTPFVFSDTLDYYFVVDRSGGTSTSNMYAVGVFDSTVWTTSRVFGGYSLTSLFFENMQLYFVTVRATCSDSIQNQNETGVDIGGVCRTLTRLDRYRPLSDSITTSNTFNIEYVYYVNSVIDSDLTKVSITVCPKSYTLDDCTVVVQDVTGFDQSYNNTISITVPSGMNGLYEVSVALWNGLDDKTCSWWRVGCISTVSRLGAGDIWSFSVINLSGEYGTPEAISDSQFYINDDCSVTDYACIVGSALKDLFVPNMQDITSSYQDSLDSFSTRIPFSYVYGLRDIITDLSSSTASGLSISVAFGSSNITLLSSESLSSNPISPIVKSSLSTVIWLLFAYLVYKRGISLFN